MNPKHDLRRAFLDQVCSVCQRRSLLISANLGVCRECIRNRPEESIAIASALHSETREAFDLPISPPRTTGGARCALCAQECVIGEGERGY